MFNKNITVALIVGIVLGIFITNLAPSLTFDRKNAIILILIFSSYAIGGFFIYKIKPSNNKCKETILCNHCGSSVKVVQKIKCDDFGCNITIVKLYAKIGYTLFIVGSISLLLLCFVSAYKLIW